VHPTARSIRTTALATGGLVLGLCAGTTTARAQATLAPSGADDRPWNQGVTLDRREAAREVFLEGNRLFRVPLFAQATARYTAAIAIWPHPALHFNLALAQLNLGLEVEARDNLARAIQAGPEPLGAEQYQEAQNQLAEVERLLGRLRVTCSTPGAEVTLDGVTLFTGPGDYQGWTKAGRHELTAKQPGYLSEARRITVAAGGVEAISLSLITLREASESGRRWASWKPWAVVAGGAAVLIGGGALHTMASRNFTAYDAGFVQLACAQATGCQEADIGPSLNAQLRLAHREQQLAVAGYLAGGALIAAGAALVYLNRPRLADEASPRSSAGGVAVLPIVSPDQLGLRIEVTR
jgi:tetratricopeptide (TPR) repeat protein